MGRFPSSTTSMRQPDAAEVFGQALAHYKAGRLSAAKSACEQVVSAWPRHAEGWHLLGALAYQQRDLGDAVRHFGRAYELSAGDLRFVLSLAKARHAAGDYG